MEFDFSKSATVESLDTVPEQFRGAYVEAKEGGFAIADHAKGMVEAVVGLNSAIARERKATQEAKAQRDQFKAWTDLGESPDAVRETIADLQSQIEKASDGKINLDKMKADMEKAKNQAIEGEQAKSAAMFGSLQKHMVESAAVTALAEAKGSVDLLLPHVMSKAKVVQDGEDFTVRVFDEAGDPRGDGKGGFMGVKELVAEMKNSPSFGRAFEASDTRGSGGSPGAGRPGSRGTQAPTTAIGKIRAGLEKRA